MNKHNVAILLFPGVEILDFAGPLEVFSVARSLGDSSESLMNVFTVAESLAPIRCNNPLTVVPAYTLENCPSIDLLLVPGGHGTDPAMERSELIAWIKTRATTAELTASVCTGSFLLAKAGLLDGKSATTYFGSIDTMRQTFPDVDVQENARWVDMGDIISSAGVSAGIDMSLHILKRLYSAEVANQAAQIIEYEHWKDGANSTSAVQP